MQIVRHTCGGTLARQGKGTYTASAADNDPITRCPSCDALLSDDCLYSRGRCLKEDDDEPEVRS